MWNVRGTWKKVLPLTQNNFAKFYLIRILCKHTLNIRDEYYWPGVNKEYSI